MNQTLIIAILILIFLYISSLKREEPTQNEIQELVYVDKKQYQEEFPYPQISHSFQKLSKGDFSQPLNNLKELLPDGPSTITQIRDEPETMDKTRMYLPDYYRKDRMSGNTIGTEEMRPFLMDSETSESSWTDENISEHPRFYNSDISGSGLTDIGSFFDKNNQYHDKTSSNTDVLATDGCYITKDGEHFCEDNTKLQNIPPSLITDVKKCYAINSIGSYKDMDQNDSSKDRIINGGQFFNSVFGKTNEDVYSQPLQPQLGDCVI